MNNMPENKKIQPWDDIVAIRALDLEQATDFSYTHTIKPWVLDGILKYTNENSHILDIGCGCGYLTNCIYELNRHNILGIDISQVSVDYAQRKYSHIKFECQDICTMISAEKFDLCTAVMVLNNCADIDALLASSYKSLNPGGHMLIVLPHPCFWPVKHVKTDFVYSEERSYEVPFATKACSDYNANITYYHRPVEIYLNSILQSGFQIEAINELCETPCDAFPDIMCIHAVKSNNNVIYQV